MQMQMRQLKGLKQGRAAARPTVAARPARQAVKVSAKAASSEELGFKTMRDGIKVRQSQDTHTLWSPRGDAQEAAVQLAMLAFAY